jgi:arylsulfatase A-like enzyme/Flp pilus assembly protein TadD
MRTAAVLCAIGLAYSAACASPPPLPPAAAKPARNLVLVTIDTLRADRVGAYGYAAARTPSLDRLAHEGARFDKAYTPAPITLTAHASLLTGLYPAGHGARHNGMAMRAGVPTLATVLRQKGFAAAAFVAAFPLDRRFGLAAGFDPYSDRMPRGADGRLANERPGREVVDEATSWLARQQGPFFLWVHLFEPHAPYGTNDAAARRRSAVDRYDEDVAAADLAVGRLIEALGTRRAETIVVAAGDHGEAFGEHGELGHSLFVYDTTLRVPLIVAGPGVPAGQVVGGRACLVDVAPTALRLLGLAPFDADGVDLAPAMAGRPLPARALVAETFAPLLDFGWSPLRSVRDGAWKAVAAPRPELFDVNADPREERDRSASETTVLRGLLERIERYAPSEIAAPPDVGAGDRDARARLDALGYLQRSAGTGAAGRPDPKDRREQAARIARVTSGEAQGAELLSLLQALARDDPHNGQVRLRLGHALLEEGRPAEAEAHFAAAAAAALPTADPYLGLAACRARRGAVQAALAALRAGDRVEPGNPVVQANLGVLEAQAGRLSEATSALERALAIAPDMQEARFDLARVYARAGRRADALAQATELRNRLPASAPQRAEVERLIAALR